MTNSKEPEQVVWEAYSSLGQFSWLYFLSLWTASRGFIFLYAGVPGWMVWMVGGGILLGVAVILRYWAKYLISTRQVFIQNGYSGNLIRCASQDRIYAIEVIQEPFAKFLGIGTVVVLSHDSNQPLRFRGVKNPDIVETKLRALLPASSPVFSKAL